jgi:hypothetical protein
LGLQFGFPMGARSTSRSVRVAVAALVGALVVVASAAAAALERPSSGKPSVRSPLPPLPSATPGAARTIAPVTSGRRAKASRSTTRLRPVDGGPGYYGRFSNPLPTRPSYFPIGVWLECVNDRGDVKTDKDVGLNVYVVLCATGQSALNLARANGMRVIGDYEWPFAPGPGSETAGYHLGDELDMTMGPAGCAEVKRRKARLPTDRRLRHSNYGKGVLFWESRAEAACFVNAQDLVSTDAYWFSDNNICGESEGGRQRAVVKADDCHVAANYGWQVSRVRSFVSPARSKPVWAFVEVGHPAGQDDWPGITPPQIRAAVWHSIIAGARGIIYFNHSFGGPCQTQHALRERCYAAERAMVKSVNAQIKSLAPVLNAPFVTSRWRHSRSTRAMVKWHGGQFYVFAGSASTDSSAASFSMRCVGNAAATVIGENRKLAVRRGAFTDAFADGNTVHIYRIDDGSACGLKRRS